MRYIPNMSPPTTMEEALRQLQIGMLDRNSNAVQGALKNARLGMRKFGKEAQNYPGRLPGGTGSTGLASTDAQGYAALLRERMRYLQIQKLLQG